MTAVVFYCSKVNGELVFVVVELSDSNEPVEVLHIVKHPFGLAVESVLGQTLTVDSVWYSFDSNLDVLDIRIEVLLGIGW